MSGTRELLRLALRRDRVYLPVWIFFFVAGAGATATSYSSLYDTLESRRKVIAGLGSTPATLALYGRIYSDSIGGLTAWRLGGLLLALVGLMSLLIVIRHTRADEETGRTELLGAAVVGRRAPLTAALLVAGGANLVLALLVTIALVAAGYPVGGSVALAVVLAAGGIMFAGVGAVAAQVAVFARSATAIAAAALAAAYLIRAVGDAGPHWLSWLSPLGWAQQLRPFADERWWTLLPCAAFTAALVVTAYALLGRRDLGAGLIAPKPGPPRGSLTTPLGLAWRLQRGALAGWAAGYAILGVALGSLASGIGKVIGDSRSVRDALAELGGNGSLADAYLAATMSIFGVIAAVYAVQALLRLKGEEDGGHAEALLATAVPRRRWLASHAGIAAGGTVAILLAGGLAAGIAHGQPLRIAAAALVQAPAAWVIAALTLAAYGLAPKLSVAGWVAIALCILLSELGPVLKLSDAVLGISPFSHVPQLPGGAFTAAPLTLTLIAAALAAAGFAAFARRDAG
jgi:ABC-2 type transport system permease protein